MKDYYYIQDPTNQGRAPIPDYYAFLGIPYNADSTTIQNAIIQKKGELHNQLAYHNVAATQTNLLKASETYFNNPIRKERYDSKLRSYGIQDTPLPDEIHTPENEPTSKNMTVMPQRRFRGNDRTEPTEDIPTIPIVPTVRRKSRPTQESVSELTQLLTSFKDSSVALWERYLRNIDPQLKERFANPPYVLSTLLDRAIIYGALWLSQIDSNTISEKKPVQVIIYTDETKKNEAMRGVLTKGQKKPQYSLDLTQFTVEDQPVDLRTTQKQVLGPHEGEEGLRLTRDHITWTPLENLTDDYLGDVEFDTLRSSDFQLLPIGLQKHINNLITIGEVLGQNRESDDGKIHLEEELKNLNRYALWENGYINEYDEATVLPKPLIPGVWDIITPDQFLTEVVNQRNFVTLEPIHPDPEIQKYGTFEGSSPRKPYQFRERL